MTNRSKRIIALIKEIFDDNHLERIAAALGMTAEAVESALRKGGFDRRTLLLIRLLRDAKAAGNLDQALRAVAEEGEADAKHQAVRCDIDRDEAIRKLVDEDHLTIVEAGRHHGISGSRARQILARARRRQLLAGRQVSA